MIESHPDILRIIEEARNDGWVLEPDAKRLFSLAGFTVPRFVFLSLISQNPGDSDTQRRAAFRIGGLLCVFAYPISLFLL